MFTVQGSLGAVPQYKKHRHAPEIGHKADVRGQDRSLLRSCSGWSHAMLPAPTNLCQCDIDSLNSFSIVLRFCQLVPMSSSFYCLFMIVYAAPITGKPLPASQILQRKPRKATVSVLFVLLFLQVKTRFMYLENLPQI